jgi:hypothetical protein
MSGDPQQAATTLRTRIATLETALEAADRLHDAIDATVAKGGATLWAERYEAMRAYRTARTDLARGGEEEQPGGDRDESGGS